MIGDLVYLGMLAACLFFFFVAYGMMGGGGRGDGGCL